MSKIEEMAERYSFIEEGIDSNNNPYKEYSSQKYEGYIVGANAVLKEIEKAMDLGEPPYLISTQQAYYQAMQKIKELKGE